MRAENLTKVPGSAYAVSWHGSLHLRYLVFQHTLDFVARGFSDGGAEMHTHLVGGFPDFFS